MRLILALVTLAVLCVAAVRGLAEETLSQGYGRRGISKMFLDARAPDIPPSYSRAKIEQMMRNARTSEDYEQLADYFDYQALEYEQKAREQVNELQRLVTLPYHARSYPMQFASTREQIQRYRATAHECSDRARAYREQTNVSGGTK